MTLIRPVNSFGLNAVSVFGPTIGVGTSPGQPQLSTICCATNGQEGGGGGNKIPDQVSNALVPKTGLTPLFKDQPGRSGDDRQHAPLNLGVSVVQVGGIKYLVDHKGRKISDEFRELKLYVADTADNQIILFIGILGGSHRLLKVQTDPLKINSAAEDYHNFVYREDLGSITAEIGAYMVIIDPVTGTRAHDQGYHEIIKKDGIFYGERGATLEPIKFRVTRHENPRLTEIPISRLLNPHSNDTD